MDICRRLAAGDGEHALIVAVFRQHIGAVGEKGWMRQAVILDDDRLVHLGEHTVETGGDTPATAQVLIGKVARHLAGPVDSVSDGAGFLAQRLVRLVPLARSVGEHEKPPRLCLAHPCEHLLRPVWAIEDDHDDGHLKDIAHGAHDSRVRACAAPTPLWTTGRAGARNA